MNLKEVNASNPKINYLINTGALVRFDDTALFLVGCVHMYIYIYCARASASTVLCDSDVYPVLIKTISPLLV